MKKIYLIGLLLMFICCKKSDSPILSGNPKDSTKATPTPVGTVTGAAVSVVIGKDGGSISSSDGTVELNIPANALTENTTITMQPITNNCPGAGMASYRFGPNGLHFNQTATLKIHYSADELKSTMGDLMGIAYQDSSGIWYRFKDFTNDATEMMLTTSIKHFTDYADFYLLHINPEAATLKVGASKDLTVEVVHSDDDDDLPPLPGSTTGDITVSPLIIYKTNQCVWSINGGLTDNDYGHFISDQGRLSITYQAPDKIPGSGNPVAVSADIDMGGMVFHGKKYNKTTLVSNIRIADQITFEIKITQHTVLGESPTTYQVVDYTDLVSFNVDLKIDPSLVTDTGSIYNIVNTPPTVSPASFSHDGYSYVLQPDPYGEINVVSGHYETDFLLQPVVTIDFLHKDAASSKWQVTDPLGVVSYYGGSPFGKYGSFVTLIFNLMDEPQTIDMSPGLIATITPVK